MRSTRLALLCATILVSGPAVAGDPCPTLAPGQAYPWQTTELMPGDFWAELLIDLDAKGKPLRCRVAKGNLRNEQPFWFCNTMMKDGQYEPILADGVAVPGTVKRQMHMPGRKHHEADKAARKRYLAAHPEERRCYPQ